MARPPRARQASIISGALVWNVILVATLSPPPYPEPPSAVCGHDLSRKSRLPRLLLRPIVAAVEQCRNKSERPFYAVLLSYYPRARRSGVNEPDRPSDAGRDT